MTGGRTLAVNTTALDEDGRMVTFMAGATVTTKVAEGITNPKAWGDEPDEPSEPAPTKKAPAKRASSKTEK